MWAWLEHFWLDEAFFTRIIMTGSRLGLILLGEGLRAGLVPTGVAHGGSTIGPWVTLLSAFVGRARARESVNGLATRAGHQTKGEG